MTQLSPGGVGQLAVLLDSGPLGLVTHPNARGEALECKTWLARLLTAGHGVLVPAICYYEVRRELRRVELRAGVPSQGVSDLDAFAIGTGIVPITPETIMLATEFWAQARHQRQQSAPDLALDADMILCAQANLARPEEWQMPGASVVIATANVRHLQHFAPARAWRDVGA